MIIMTCDKQHATTLGVQLTQVTFPSKYHSPNTSCEILALKLPLLARCEPLTRDWEERVSLPGDMLPPCC